MNIDKPPYGSKPPRPRPSIRAAIAHRIETADGETLMAIILAALFVALILALVAAAIIAENL